MDPSLSLHPKPALNGERHSPEGQAHGATAKGLNLNRAISLPYALKSRSGWLPRKTLQFWLEIFGCMTSKAFLSKF
jgi:hypothetical protein